MQRSFSILGLILTIILFGAVQRASAAVTLIGIDATYDSDNEEVKIVWLTGTEPDTAGYFIVRSADRSALENAVEVDSTTAWPTDTLPFIEDLEVNGEEMMQIPNQGTTTTGAEYTAFDAGPADGFTENATYYYLLVEREISGRLLPTEIVSVVIADAQPTATPVSAAVGTGNNTSSPTNTPVPTNTPTPTEVPTEIPTETPVPTETSTPANDATATSQAESTNTPTPVPTATNTPIPAATNTPIAAATNTPIPAATNTPIPAATSTTAPAPTAEVINESQTNNSSDNTEPATDNSSQTGSATTDDNSAAAQTTSTDAGADTNTDADNNNTDAGTTVDNGETDTSSSSLLGAQSAEASEADDTEPEAIAQVGDAYPDPNQPADDGNTVNDAYVEPVDNQQQNVFGETETDTETANETNTVGGDNNNNAVSQISGDAQSSAIPLQPEADSGGGQTNPLLWVVFGGGLLVFVGGVIGSILIFTRQRKRQS